MYTIKKIALLLLGAFVLTNMACKKDKKSQPTVPELTTADVTEPTATTAVSGGTIISNGGETITVSGVCWSKTNANPTTADDTTKGTTSTGSFTALMKNLNSSSTYYVRAYAINRVGIGYGEVKQFTTGNAAPVATAVSITGTPKGDELLTGNYVYNDPDGDTEAGTTFQWYVANDGAGAGETPIEGATQKTFRVQDAQQGKYIRFGVTPKAGTGNQTGAEVKSAFTTAVGEATTVTFMYGGTEVTYGIIVGTSGKKWLDRNLGAKRVAQSVTDYQAYGDLFQWGRLVDGHQVIVRTDGTNAGTSGSSGTTTTLSVTDTPANSAFIIAVGGAYDWRSTRNNNLWQGVNGTNNPCPAGYHIPTEAEWIAEGIGTINDGYSKFKLTYTGFRYPDDASFDLVDYIGVYWTSTVPNPSATRSVSIAFTPDGSPTTNPSDRASGYACRCIRD
jgi:hypothetical protein